ncbi:MAG: GGDEF domain-containing protein [Planctomycetota bacterium]|jgi:diguanylate cyclase (GGDEF)-like protein
MSSKETDSDRLRRIVAHDALSVELVSAFSGDRPLTEAESAIILSLKENRAELFFSDILYAVTHQFFPADEAEKLWNEIVQHKYEISKTLKRNVQIIVATLDYLTNFKCGVCLPTLVNEAHIAEIVNLSMRDGLTGFFNHASCYELIDLELKRYDRHGMAVSLILADIDDFKIVNDLYGHQEGNRVLKELAVVIKTATRESDICSRYGGEEFVVILPMTGIQEASEIAERVRIAAMQINAGGSMVTISSGVVSCDEKGADSYDLIEKADIALYEAKKKGKNRVVVFEDGTK